MRKRFDWDSLVIVLLFGAATHNRWSLVLVLLIPGMLLYDYKSASRDRK